MSCWAKHFCRSRTLRRPGRRPNGRWSSARPRTTPNACWHGSMAGNWHGSIAGNMLKSDDLASHAHDDGFHEIQLSGKQLVFLFMAATVVSVVIFLCGVLVGRGVRAERGGTIAEAMIK